MKKIKIAIQGELGAYSHIAANNLYKDAEINTDKNNILVFKFLTIKKEIIIHKINIAILFKFIFNSLLFIQSNLVPRAIKNKKGIKNGIIN